MVDRLSHQDDMKKEDRISLFLNGYNTLRIERPNILFAGASLSSVGSPVECLIAYSRRFRAVTMDEQFGFSWATAVFASSVIFSRGSTKMDNGGSSESDCVGRILISGMQDVDSFAIPIFELKLESPIITSQFPSVLCNSGEGHSLKFWATDPVPNKSRLSSSAGHVACFDIKSNNLTDRDLGALEEAVKKIGLSKQLLRATINNVIFGMFDINTPYMANPPAASNSAAKADKAREEALAVESVSHAAPPTYSEDLSSRSYLVPVPGLSVKLCSPESSDLSQCPSCKRPLDRAVEFPRRLAKRIYGLPLVA
ncbi:hypothetical protein BJ742DRAFT_734992 [Cladochytrium replicatum]|nr:hypothetical protein BJ742DRAFT_734992 [Cladochytrium replicatum]